MTVGGKIAVGAIATALLATGAHFASGQNFVNGLQSNAETALADRKMDGVSVAFGTDPLSRSAMLSGDVDDAAKEDALTLVRSQPGVSSAYWADDGTDNTNKTDGDAGGNAANVTPATKEKVNECQSGVNKSIEGKTINFASGSAYVSPASNRILNSVAEALKPCSGLSIEVGGHTDALGNADVNQALSQERANRIRDGLVKRGLTAVNITAVGFGSEQPKAEGNNAENRRIEFKVSAAGE